MAKKIDSENEGFPTFKGSWLWPWIGSYCILPCTNVYLHAKFHSNWRTFFVDWQT